tara:strand:+ start:437 stop:595 length:159 start_codon:yes stop_codon:yes gene_type:complete
MSELGPIKPVSQPIVVNPIKKDSGNKENGKKKEKDKHDSGVNKPEGHVDEYI